MKTKPQPPSKAALKRAEKNADDACKLRDKAIKMMNKSHAEQAALRAQLDNPELVQVSRADLELLLDEVGRSYVKNSGAQGRLRQALRAKALASVVCVLAAGVLMSGCASAYAYLAGLMLIPEQVHVVGDGGAVK